MSDIYCAICLCSGELLDQTHKAVTFMGGNATCDEHVNYFLTAEVSYAVKKIREQRAIAAALE